MTTLKQNKLLQALLLAVLAGGLAACGGDDGNNGSNGSNGTDGANGTNGTDGSNGTDGTNGTDGQNGSPAFIKFVGVDAPSTDAEKREISVSQAVVNGQIYGGEYNTLARSGDDIGGVQFGQLVDESGTVLQEEDLSVRISDSNEFTSLLPIGEKLFSVSQFEDRPGAMFLMELDQNAETGALSVSSLSQIDQSGIHGGWVHCAGSVTPWTTHLGSEEYEPNAKDLPTSTEAAADSYTAGMLDYYTTTEWNPYFYGWPVEITVTEDGTATPEKHYAMARLAFELEYVMPDSKTVYMTDDGTNVGLYMFVADTAGDLSAGTTYVAKWNQTSSAGLGSADLTWIDLGHATNADIEEYVTNGTTFTDIFDEETMAGDGTCPTAGFTPINTATGAECLKVKDGMEMAASRLETRRYAAMMGGSTEFRKEEGITYDSKRHKLYLAISEVARGMEDFAKNGSASNSYDLGGHNDVTLDNYNGCGGVYQLDLGPDADMGSNYVAMNMYGLVAGRGITGSGYEPDSEAEAQVAGFEANNDCHIDGIANPDNVTYMSGYDYLIIGEDTGSGHQNDVIWAYNFEDESLTRIQTTPYGSETTSPYWYPNINGWAYMMSVVQHPYGESDSDQDTGAGEARAYTGYIGPIPAVNVQ